MARLVLRPIRVTLKDDKPHAFIYGGYAHVITLIVDRWQESGQWWMDEPPHTIYTVMTADNFLYDIEHVADEWFIYRVWD